LETHVGRLQLQKHENRLAVERGPDHHDRRRLLQDLHLRLEDLRLILADHDLYFPCGCGAHRSISPPASTPSSMHVPFPGADVIRKSPDTFFARSRMLASP